MPNAYIPLRNALEFLEDTKSFRACSDLRTFFDDGGAGADLRVDRSALEVSGREVRFMEYDENELSSAIDFALAKGWNPPQKYRLAIVEAAQLRVGDVLHGTNKSDPVTGATVKAVTLTLSVTEVSVAYTPVDPLPQRDWLYLRLRRIDPVTIRLPL